MYYADAYIDGLDKAIRSLDLSVFERASVLITGASGLIGSALCDVLLRAKSSSLNVNLFFAGRNIKRLKERFSYWPDALWMPFVYEALQPPTFRFSADYIFHCASNAHPALFTAQPVETITANVLGTSNILAYARDAKTKRVLYVSSSEVYGSRDSQEPYKETDCCPVDLLNPRACYPNSKRVCETLCAAYGAEYGVESVIVRPGHVYGPTATESDSRAHAQFAREAAAGNTIVMKSPGNQLRSYIYGTDCAAALLTVMLKGSEGEAYNIGAPDFTCTIRELAEAFASAGRVSIVNDFPSAAEAAGYNMMSCSALDCSKLATLGFNAQTSLAQGAAQNIACWKAAL